jgi:hypothetical protein
VITGANSGIGFETAVALDLGGFASIRAPDSMLTTMRGRSASPDALSARSVRFGWSGFVVIPLA